MRQELYRGNIYRVVWSQEEKAAAMADGWSEIMEPGVEYRHFQHAEPEALPTSEVKGEEGEVKGEEGEVKSEEGEVKSEEGEVKSEESAFEVEIPDVPDEPARGKRKGRR